MSVRLTNTRASIPGALGARRNGHHGLPRSYEDTGRPNAAQSRFRWAATRPAPSEPGRRQAKAWRLSSLDGQSLATVI